MITEHAKTVLFGTLLAILVLSFGVQHAVAIGSDVPQRVDDSKMIVFLNDMVSKIGTIETTYTQDDSSVVTVVNTVTLLYGNVYEIQSVVTHQGRTINDETITVIQNTDHTVQMINEKHGFNVVFDSNNNQLNEHGKIHLHSSTNLQPLGSGSSSVSGAKVDLYDSGYKPTIDGVLHLEDSYEQCGGIRDYEAYADVIGVDYLTTVRWDSDQFYFHWCIMGHSVDRGEVSFQGNKHNWSGSYYRAGSHEFSHVSNTGLFKMESDTWYGSW